MALTSVVAPTTSEVIKGSLVENKIEEYVFNNHGNIPGSKPEYEKQERVSEIAKYRGGALYGYNIKSKGAAEIMLYDNDEKAEGTVISGPIYFKEKEQKVFMPTAEPLRFKEGIYFKIVSGEVESGVLWIQSE